MHPGRPRGARDRRGTGSSYGAQVCTGGTCEPALGRSAALGERNGSWLPPRSGMFARLGLLLTICATAVAMPVASPSPRRTQQTPDNVDIGAVSLMVNQLSASKAGYTTYQVGVRFDSSRVLDVYGTLPRIRVSIHPVRDAELRCPQRCSASRPCR